MASKFNKDWINPSLNLEWCKWLEEIESDNTKAKCRPCKKVIDLSNMGRQAILSHSKAASHKKNLSAPGCSVSLTTYFSSNKISKTEKLDSAKCCPESSDAVTEKAIENVTNYNASVSSNIEKFLINEDVYTAEILWCLKLIMGHGTFNFQSGLANIFKRMFRDSAIAIQFSLSPTKTSYMIVYGLAPFFYQTLSDDLLLSSFFVICFDEALNKIIQKEQMDIVIRYWNDQENRVSTRYLTSVFLGRTTAQDLLDKFLQAVSILPLQKILQISMDGPNVNWAFLRELSKELITDQNDPELLKLGSCGLHVIHGAFQNGHKKSGWQVNRFLRNLYYYFKDHPARRAKFTEISDETDFPLKFTTTRWLQNAAIAERAIKIFSSLRKYFFQVHKNSDSDCVNIIKKGLQDPLMLSKLNFFLTVASSCETFLKMFQSQKPMFPFLYGALKEILRDLMERFVKPEILNKVNTGFKLMQIDLNDTINILPINKINIGIGAMNSLEQVEKTVVLNKMNFFNSAKEFLKATVEKLIERSPLKYQFVRSSTCLSPKLIIQDPNICISRFEDLVKELEKRKRITALVGEKAIRQYKQLLNFKSNKELKEKFEQFSNEKNRLDDFYFATLKKSNDYIELWHVFKLVLILSHGNASVESGFSVNKQLLRENQKEKTVVALRQVYDGVSSLGGIDRVEVTKDMIQSVKGASRRYKENLSKEKARRDAENSKKELERKERKRKANEICFLKEKKEKIDEEAKILLQKIKDLEK